MTVIANHFWLLFLCIAAAKVWASDPVPTELELHHYDGGSVELLNKGSADGSADIDTNLMLFKALADAPAVREMPIARTDWMMEQGLPVCSMNRVKNRARSAKYLFSLPPSLLNNKGQITTLKALLRRYPDNQIVVPKSYSFGDALDQAVAEIPARQITAISTSHYYDNFVAMFKAGRADFILIYPTEMRAYLQNNPELKVRHYPLAQAPVYSTGHLMCADTVQTREFIQRVDAELRKLYRQPDFIAANSRTLAATEASAIRRAIKTQAQH